MDNSAKEWDYDSLSLVRDYDPAEVKSIWKNADRLSDDHGGTSQGTSRVLSRASSSRSIVKPRKLKRRKSSSVRDTGRLVQSKLTNQNAATQGNFTRLTKQASKLMVSVDAVAHGKEQQLFKGCKKWIVVVYTEAVLGMNSGFKFYIKLHGPRKSSKLLQLSNSETNQFKFQSKQSDVFTVVVQDVGDVEKITIGFKGIRPGITWKLGLVRLIDASEQSKVSEFPIERELDGEECFVTMPREDLVFDEAKLSARIAASQEIELINSNFCLHPDLWYQFGGCQMHVPEIGICTVTQRSSDGVPTGIMQDVTSALKWKRSYDVTCRARVMGGLSKTSSAFVKIVLLSKQEGREKFAMDTLHQDILYVKGGSSALKTVLDMNKVLDDDNDCFQMAFLCFVVQGPYQVNFEVENPALRDQRDPEKANLLRNSRFEMNSAVGELWRCAGIGSIQSRLLAEDRKAIVLKTKQFQSTSIAINIRDLVQPGRTYQFSCEVKLYLDEDEDQSNISANTKAPVFCSLVTSPKPSDEKWNESRNDADTMNKRANKSDESFDEMLSIAFLQNASFKKFSQMQGTFSMEADEVSSMKNIVINCMDEKLKLAVTNAKLRLLKQPKHQNWK